MRKEVGIKNYEGSDAALFRGPAAVVGDGGDIANDSEIEADGLESSDGGFTARARTADEDFHFLEAVAHGLAGSVLRDHLGSVSGAFARPFEADLAGARPADHVAFEISDGDDRVVES